MPYSEVVDAVDKSISSTIPLAESSGHVQSEATVPSLDKMTKPITQSNSTAAGSAINGEDDTQDPTKEIQCKLDKIMDRLSKLSRSVAWREPKQAESWHKLEQCTEQLQEWSLFQGRQLRQQTESHSRQWQQMAMYYTRRIHELTRQLAIVTQHAKQQQQQASDSMWPASEQQEMQKPKLRQQPARYNSTLRDFSHTQAAKNDTATLPTNVKRTLRPGVATLDWHTMDVRDSVASYLHKVASLKIAITLTDRQAIDLAMQALPDAMVEEILMLNMPDDFDLWCKKVVEIGNKASPKSPLAEDFYLFCPNWSDIPTSLQTMISIQSQMQAADYAELAYRHILFQHGMRSDSIPPVRTANEALACFNTAPCSSFRTSAWQKIVSTTNAAIPITASPSTTQQSTLSRRLGHPKPKRAVFPPELWRGLYQERSSSPQDEEES